MARYIKAWDPNALVGNGQAWWASRDDWPSNPDHPINLVNELYEVPELDFVMINWYESGNLDECKKWLRLCQDRFQKQIVVEQYAPFPLNRDTPWKRDQSPHLMSKGHEWLAACGEYGVVGPLRWPGIREKDSGGWITGGYADPQMMNIAGVTRQYASYVDLHTWKGRGRAFDDNITSNGLRRVGSWGDGEHVTMFLTWSTGGSKEVTIKGLSQDQTYTFMVFDWVKGDLISTQDANANQGKLTLVVTPGREESLVGYLRPADDNGGGNPPGPSLPPPTFQLVIQGEGAEPTVIQFESGQEYSLKAVAKEGPG
jgi:hypothetical protein